MAGLKNLLKKVLPPPVNAFNRELAEMKQFVMEQNSTLLAEQEKIIEAQHERDRALLAEQKKTIEVQKKQIDSLLQRQSALAWRVGVDSQRLEKMERGMHRLFPQPRLRSMLLNLVDHCNLNCAGCDHMSPLADKYFVSMENIAKDAARMAELMDQRVTSITISGGEPLLHPDLPEILETVRTAFPLSHIAIITNGLLLLSMKDNFWDSCHKNDVVISTTKYPIDLDFDEIQRVAKEKGVRFKFYGNTGQVQKTLWKMPFNVRGGQDPVESFLGCYHADSCYEIMEGKLYICPIALNARHFNKKFGTHMELEEGDCLDIYKAQSADEVLQFLSTPKPFCRYCKTLERSTGHPWRQSEQDMNEWLAD